MTPSQAEGVLRIAVPNPAVRDWILSQYSNALRDSLLELNLGNCRIEWATPQPKKDDPGIDVASEAGISRLVCEGEKRVSGAGQIEAPQLPDIPSAPLNEKYTFGSFVVASCNRFAHAAALAVAEAPGRTYNPLYLYGGVGLGKTHLIQATGHAIKKANPKLQVSYLSLERFMNELINAIRYGYDKTQVFR